MQDATKLLEKLGLLEGKTNFTQGHAAIRTHWAIPMSLHGPPQSHSTTCSSGDSNWKQLPAFNSGTNSIFSRAWTPWSEAYMAVMANYAGPSTPIGIEHTQP